jgi:ribosome-binding protein aMBF1 (putative translation factor)
MTEEVHCRLCGKVLDPIDDMIDLELCADCYWDDQTNADDDTIDETS